MAESMFSVELRDEDGLRRVLNVVPKKFPRKAERNMFETAKIYRNNVIRAMTMTPRLVNVFYKIGKGKNKKVHHPSAPYFPPARMNSDLVDRMQVEKFFEWRSYGAIFYIKGAPYAPILEDGSQDGTLKPRPVYEKELDRLRFPQRVFSKFARDFK